MTKIYCVEDDESIRELISYAMKSAGFVCQGFESGISFKEALSHEPPPDLVLMDIMLPGEDGLGLLDDMRADSATRNTPVIMLTAKTSEVDRVRGLDRGADDYICKPFGVMELISRVKAVLRRCAGPVADIIRYRNLTLSYDQRTVEVDGRNVKLTYKEFELLYFLLSNQGMVLSRDRMLQTIWGYEYEGETRTVDMHIKTLRQKLEAQGCADLIVTVRGIGYKVEKDR
jgi:two-component system alkaline phosphatase synthesis response regulator PhoP